MLQPVRLVLVALTLVTALAVVAASPPGDALPAGVCTTLRAERAKYPTPPGAANVGALLNATAWTHRALGLGVGRKTTGTRCPSPAGDITCDYLIRQSDMVGWDVLIDADGAASVTCTGSGVTITNRPWVAPVNPGIPGPDPCPDCPTCPTCPPPSSPHPVSAAQFQALDAYAKSLEARVASLEQRVGALEGARYVVRGSTSRDWGHGHGVDIPVERVP